RIILAALQEGRFEFAHAALHPAHDGYLTHPDDLCVLVALPKRGLVRRVRQLLSKVGLTVEGRPHASEPGDVTAVLEPWERTDGEAGRAELLVKLGNRPLLCERTE